MTVVSKTLAALVRPVGKFWVRRHVRRLFEDGRRISRLSRQRRAQKEPDSTARPRLSLSLPYARCARKIRSKNARRVTGVVRARGTLANRALRVFPLPASKGNSRCGDSSRSHIAPAPPSLSPTTSAPWPPPHRARRSSMALQSRSLSLFSLAQCTLLTASDQIYPRGGRRQDKVSAVAVPPLPPPPCHHPGWRAPGLVRLCPHEGQGGRGGRHRVQAREGP